MDSVSTCALDSNADGLKVIEASVLLDSQLLNATHEAHLINSIIESLLDNADEYRRAIFGLEQLLDTLQCRLYNRVHALEQLQAHVASLGSKPVTTRSTLGAAFASLLASAQLFSRTHQQDLMQDVDRGERTLKMLLKRCLADKRLSTAGRECVTRTIDQLSIDQYRPAELRSSHDLGAAQGSSAHSLMPA
jgi:hypothetical protein